MSTSAEAELENARATAVRVTRDAVVVDLEDGRRVSVPLSWYPRLRAATAAERKRLRIGAFGIHWPALDEDISYRSMLLGRRSGENPEFTAWWIQERQKGRKPTLMKWLALRKKQRTTVEQTNLHGRGARATT